jgi:hypothetical protein
MSPVDPLHRQSERVCADCGAANPYLIDFGDDGRLVCEHRYACEARQMLTAGVPVAEAAAHAQQRRPW